MWSCTQRSVKSLSIWLSHLASVSYCRHWTFALLFALPNMWGPKAAEPKVLHQIQSLEPCWPAFPSSSYPQHTLSCSHPFLIPPCVSDCSPWALQKYITYMVALQKRLYLDINCYLMLVSWRNSLKEEKTQSPSPIYSCQGCQAMQTIKKMPVLDVILRAQPSIRI